MNSVYAHFRRLRIGITEVETDGARYLRSLLDGDPQWQATGESLIARIHRNEEIDVPSEFFDAGIGWPETIKALRTIYGMSIAEAQDLALQDKRWLRWVKQRCLADRSCAKQAHYAARHGTLKNWITLKDGKATFIK